MLKNKNGIIALPTILVMSSVIIDVAVIVTLGIIFLNNSDYGVRLSNEALAAAKAGVQDGLMKLARDKNFDASTPYTLTVDDRTVSVTVCGGTEACGGANNHKISAEATAFTKKKKVEAVVTVNAATGIIYLQSLKEVSI